LLERAIACITTISIVSASVKHIDRISLPAPRLRQADGFQVVEGENPKGEKILVLWRKVRDLNETEP
jgi:hypothetical protein